LLVISLLIGAIGALNVTLVYTIMQWGFGAEAGKENMFVRFNEFTIARIPIDDPFIAACVLFLAVSALFCIFMFIEVIVRATLVSKIIITTRMNIFKKFVGADYQYFLDHKQGDLIYRAGVAPGFLTSLYFSVATIFSDAILLCALSWVVFMITWKGFVALLVLAALYLLLAQFIGYKRLYFFGQEMKRAGQDYNVFLNESITGIKAIKVNLFQDSWIKKVSDAVRKNYYYYRKSRLWEKFPMILLLTLFYFSLGIAAIVMRLRYHENFVVVLPALGALGFAVLNLIPKLSSIGVQRMRILQALPHVELTYETLTTQNRKIISGTKTFERLQSSIQFEDVHFAHRGRTELLKGMSMSFNKGKVTAIVGKSGSGKSTIVHLLLRLFDPNAGMVSVDGQDLKDFELSSWLRKIGFVDQDVFVYNATVRENILFGLGNVSDSDIISAAKTAHAHEFIVNLPQGYDTLVGDRGVKLSGGEKQRIAIARAVLRKPELLILDEATASLDNVSEAIVQKAIDEILKDHTVIVIAHRLSTIQNADKIIVLDEGRVVEEGTHAGLINQKRMYWNLYNSQKTREPINQHAPTVTT